MPAARSRGVGFPPKEENGRTAPSLLRGSAGTVALVVRQDRQIDRSASQTAASIRNQAASCSTGVISADQPDLAQAQYRVITRPMLFAPLDRENLLVGRPEASGRMSSTRSGRAQAEDFIARQPEGRIR